MTTAPDAPAAPLSATTSERALLLTRIFDAPPALLFRLWTEGEHLARWCAPKGFTIPEGGGDVRPGGAWWSVMVAPDGTVHRLGGTYLTVEPPHRLAFTHAWRDAAGQPGHATIVTVTLDDLGDGRTRLSLHQAEFDSVPARDGHAGGWSECLDRLDALARQIAQQQGQQQ